MSVIDNINWVDAATAAAALATTAIASYRWLRVSQREHYHPGRATSVALQWIRNQPLQMAPLAAGLAFAGIALTDHRAAPILAVIAGGIAALAPRTMPVRNTDQRLKFTPRAKRLAATTAALAALPLALSWDGRYVVFAGLLAPGLVDLAAAITKPIEKQFAMRFVRQASAKLKQIRPDVVAITGSYGKTTTKNYVAHFVSPVRNTVPTPASFNNLLGLTRSVNEKVAPGTEVFVAEMGTYGPGEITELCKYFKPTIAAITTIGEAHLERMGSRATIVTAKREILEPAHIWVLNIDVPELAQIADAAPAGITVIRCSATDNARASVRAVPAAEGGLISLTVAGEHVCDIVPSGAVHPINIAVAAAIANHLGVPNSIIAKQAANLPTVASRGVTQRTDNGVTIIDDTFNANPDGAERALANAAQLTKPGKTLWVVTPGMFELGTQMHARNHGFAASVLGHTNARLIGVGGTNRKAFTTAASEASATDRFTWFNLRREAVAHVMAQAQLGDVVLYENDRPDHLP